jgi:oligopeptide/dipeptide ABC transporter ATP-binding protein
MAMSDSPALLELAGLSVVYPVRGARRTVRAVEDVTLSVREGESVALVGESGSGKSTLGHAAVGLAPAAAGRVLHRGRDVASLSGEQARRYRREIQMVFQDPGGSLHPRLSVGGALAEVFRVHGTAPAGRAAAAVDDALALVGLDPSASDRYPHELSGGQRQRVALARALAVRPALVIADEPVSALDVSVQAQILNLMRDLRARLGLAYLLIAHDLAVVRYLCDRVVVLYFGRVMEEGPTAAVLSRPAHPYTEALLAAAPDVARSLAARAAGRTPDGRLVPRGDVPSRTEPIAGCPFHGRCHRARPVCGQSRPAAVPVGPGRVSCCHFAAGTGGGS